MPHLFHIHYTTLFFINIDLRHIIGAVSLSLLSAVNTLNELFKILLTLLYVLETLVTPYSHTLY